MSGFLVTIIFSCGDFLNTRSYRVPWISIIGELSLTFAISSSFWTAPEGKCEVRRR
jgi:hypothetical protein